MSPPTTTVSIGAQVPLQAVVQDASGNTVTGVDVHWSVQDSTIATISSTGVVTGVALGSTQVAASAGGQSGIGTITVSKTPVSSVVVTPPHVDAAPGVKTQFAATAFDATQNALPGRALTWSTSDAGVATADASGLVSAIGPGTATITAMSEGKSGVATITVSQAAVATVAVAPSPLSMSVGQATQLTATLEDAVGNVLNGRAVSWSSSNPAVASVSSQGMVTGVAPGGATITATSEGKSGTASVTITNVAVGSVTVQPQGPSVVLGTNTQLSATVRDVNGNAVTDRAVAWSSSNSAVATVSPSGVVKGVAIGSAAITATSEGKSGATIVTVVQVPVGSVVVSPATASTRLGSTTTLTATVTDQNGTVVTNRVVTWTSSNPAVATVAGGVVTGVATGVATITATSEGKSGTAAVTVTGIPVGSVTVSPTTTMLVVSQTVALSVTVKDSLGAVVTDRAVSWSSSSAAVATVSSAGVVTAVAAGSATITATSEGKSGTSTITVLAPIATIAVAPSTKTILAGDTAPFTATAKDASGNVLSGRVLVWSSSNPSVATVSATGVATGTGVGVATITATAPVEGKSGSATLTVNAASVSVTPSPDSTYIGQTATLTAIAKDKSGNAVPAQGVSWSSNNAGIATVSQAGVVSGVAAGSANIVATVGGQSGQATVKVVAPVASVTVSPANPPAISTKQSITLQATLKDASNNVIGPGRVVTWTTTDPTGIVTITPKAGTYSVTVTGNIAGTVTITATSEGKTGTAIITVKK